jgi:lactoylglutathione lyase
VITKASTVGIDVSDQDRALDFYTNKLGFEKLMDEPMSPESEVRWIEVAPAGAETHVVLFKPTGQ